jgi:polysaccharide deacetylase family protein (PEP-CTERM system associated)
VRILAFDVEDWFHILDNASTRTEKEWQAFPSRIHEATDRILKLLSDRQLAATFFCLGWVAERFPQIVKRIASLGHEVASHSHRHQLVYEQSPAELREDVVRSIAVLEDLTGHKVRAYRAPGFSATPENPWLFDVLHESGIEIDCSIFPARRAHGGFPGFPPEPTWIELNGARLKEFPMNTTRLLGRDLVFSGGGYFRLLPYPVIRRLVDQSPYLMTYFHPRDFDPDQPVLEDLGPLRRFKSYVGLRSAYRKLEALLDDTDFVDLATADRQVDWDRAPVVPLGRAASPPRTELLGIEFDRVGLDGAMARVAGACESRKPLQIVTVNLNFLTLVDEHPSFGEVINNAGLSVVDGRILLWATHLQGEPTPEQITGHDLFRECIQLASERNYGIFLLGGAPGVALDVAAKLVREHPGLRVTGTDGGRFAADGTAERQEELAAQIREFRPEILFVALGAPKQDTWIAAHQAELGVPVAVGVGCVFDVVSGRIPRAPHWMQVAGLESVFQLALAPGRYARRYLVNDPPTLARLSWDVLKKRFRSVP